MIKEALCGVFCLCCTGALAQQVSDTKVINLDQGWMFSQSGANEWRDAIVPGTVHQDLLKHGLLPDPFYGTNEKKIQWVEEKDWEYKTTFTLSDSLFDYDAARITFEGLDTYADVYLNGALLLKADNMFVGYDVPVKNLLRKGENRLNILFHSPITSVMPQFESNGFNYPADNDHRKERLSVFTRKAPYSYGWDWGIRMVTSGVWRPVTLTFYNVATIDDFYVRQLSVTKEKAEIKNELTLNSVSDKDRTAEAILSYSVKGGEETVITKTVTLNKGENIVDIPLTISNPQLWMPNGWGEPVMYDFKAKLICDGKVVAEKDQRIGLRSIRVVNEKDADGESFYFEVNGQPMFAKGANYIPDDALLPNITKERYETLFRDTKEANMNMLRVWGGGTYEDDYFYQLADENGILIWQDFMFACTSYPHDPAFMKRVSEEADYNIKRLRNHACLAIWCGNNEVLEAMKYYGWQKKFSEAVYQDMWKGYDELFKVLLPAKVKELDPDRFYVHSSPYFANWGRPDSWGIGDSHNWGVWYGKHTFESLNKNLPRFMSEFGFQSFPEMKTIATFASPADYEIESEVMNGHQKSSIGNALIKTYMERDYKIPEKFEDFVYVGLVLQGKGMRIGMEAHRRNRPYCMGTLYWQLNDSWPVVSWSSIDYYGNWKALHYQTQRAFAPVLVNPLQEGDSLCYYILSDKLEPLNGITLDIRQIDFNGKQLRRNLVKGSVAANTSAMIGFENMGIFTPEQRKNTFLQLTVKDKSGKVLNENVYFFEPPKNLDLPETEINCKVKQLDGRCEVTLSSKKLAKDVFVEIPIQGARFTDNFFDLLPGQARKVIITSPQIKNDGNVNITVRHLRETY